MKRGVCSSCSSAVLAPGESRSWGKPRNRANMRKVVAFYWAISDMLSTNLTPCNTLTVNSIPSRGSEVPHGTATGLSLPPPSYLLCPHHPHWPPVSFLSTLMNLLWLCCGSVAKSCLILCDLMDCSLPGSSVHGVFPGKDTRVGCHSLLQGIFTTQGSNSGFLYWQAGFLPSEPPQKSSFGFRASDFYSAT